MDSGFDENQSELGVLVLSVSLEVLTDLDGLLDQVVKILWDIWGETLITLSAKRPNQRHGVVITVRLENSQNLVSCDCQSPHDKSFVMDIPVMNLT